MIHVNRREFTQLASVGVGGLIASSLVNSPASFAQDRDPSSQRLVLLGLNALARAHEKDYFTDGHRGAALIAAHLLCVENNLDEEATARIVQLFELNWASTALCRPFPNTEPNLDQVAKIGDRLSEGGSVLRQVGHDAIFAMLAI